MRGQQVAKVVFDGRLVASGLCVIFVVGVDAIERGPVADLNDAVVFLFGRQPRRPSENLKPLFLAGVVMEVADHQDALS